MISIPKRPGEQISERQFEETAVGIDFNNCRLEWARGKKITFKKCNFSSSLIKNCYFHKAHFIECDFTGALFQDSNFRGATFDQCKFEYAQFRGTLIEANQLLKNLPSWENTRRELLRSLRKNAESIGEVEEVRRYFWCEMEAGIEHWRAASKGVAGYYLDHYPGPWGRFTSFYRWLVLVVSKWAWGHGDSPLKLVCSTLAWLVLLSFMAQPCIDGSPEFIEILTSILATLLGVPLTNTLALPQWVLLIAGASRYLFLGLFATVFVRRFARR